MFDVTVIGDTVVDTYIPLLEAHIAEKDGQTMISLPFGHKVPVGDAISLVAGNGANVAVGLARLGLKTAIYTHVGNKDDEEFDDQIKSKLKSEKVDLRYVAEIDSLPSNHNIVLTFNNERTILTHHQNWNYSLPDLEQSNCIYLTSLSGSVEKTHLLSDLVRFLERTGAKLVFQPGTFQIKLGIKKQSRLLGMTQVLIMNKEEAQIFLSIDPEKKVEMKILLQELHDLGPKNVIVTDGREGSFGFDGEYFYQLGLFPAELVEMTGAGDAYASGVTAALLQGKELSEAMRWGTANSAGVVEAIGPQKGLLHKTKMEAVLRAQKAIVAEEM